MNSQTLRWAVPGGLVLAIVYTLSPLTVWVAALAAICLVASRHGLPVSERRLLTILVVTAMAIRAAVVVLLFLRNIPYHHDAWLGVLTGDDAYGMARALRGRDLLLGVPANRYDAFVLHDMYGENIYNDLLLAVQTLLGPAPYGMRLLNALFFVAGALVLFRFARSAYGRLPAFAALAFVLFLPSFFVWSISLLKEPLYFFATAVFLAAAAHALRASAPGERVAAGAAAFAALYVMDAVRHHTLAIGIVGAAAGVALWLIARRPRRYVPLAGVAVVAAVVAVAAVGPVQERVLSGLEEAAKIHAGHVFTLGHGYRTLDEYFYVRAQNAASSTLTLSADEAARFVVRSIAAFVATPLPWEAVSIRELAYVPEQLVWYALVALLPIGVAAGLRRDAAATAMLVGYLVPTALVLALTNGNVGTIVRLRGMVEIIVVWMSALGACVAAARLLERRAAAPTGWRPVPLEGTP